MQLAKLKVLKQSYLSEHYDLEDRILKYFPQTIKEYEKCIAGYESDAAFANKGYTSADILEQCRKLDEAGIEYYFVYMTGLAGKDGRY